MSFASFLRCGPRTGCSTPRGTSKGQSRDQQSPPPYWPPFFRCSPAYHWPPGRQLHTAGSRQAFHLLVPPGPPLSEDSSVLTQTGYVFGIAQTWAQRLALHLAELHVVPSGWHPSSMSVSQNHGIAGVRRDLLRSGDLAHCSNSAL